MPKIFLRIPARTFRPCHSAVPFQAVPSCFASFHFVPFRFASIRRKFQRSHCITSNFSGYAHGGSTLLPARPSSPQPLLPLPCTRAHVKQTDSVVPKSFGMTQCKSRWKENFAGKLTFNLSMESIIYTNFDTIDAL